MKKKRKHTPPKEENQVLFRSEAPSHSKSKIYFNDKRYYFNITSRRWKKHTEGDWDNGPLIYKVPLSPEQAVLTCCILPDTGATPMSARFFHPTGCNFVHSTHGTGNCPTSAGKGGVDKMKPYYY